VKLISYTPDSALESSIASLEQVLKPWRFLSFAGKIAVLSQIADALLQNKTSLAQLAAQEMGKPLKSGELEIEKSARALKQIPLLWKTPEEGLEAQPFGIVFSVQPWNFPFWQVFRMCATAWTTGNVVLLKHSELVPETAQAIEKLCLWNDQPLLKNVILEPSRIHQLIENDARIRFVTFTGSTEVGRLVAETCGRALKPGIFELGGNDAYLICEDADLILAAEKCAQTRLINSGQSCVSGKRFFLHRKIKSSFLQEFKKNLQMSRWGSPFDPQTEYGPLAHQKFKTKLENQILKAQAQGAHWCEIKPPSGDLPSVGYLDFGQNLRGFEAEEIFGPVALIYEFDECDEVLTSINKGPFGLAGGIFTQNQAMVKRSAQESLVGTFTWNDFSQSDPIMPFGGCKDSGFGREMGLIGLEQFVCWKALRGFP
jgi:succinate-semialdehyde dehydrogenase/glutarate-semialdehyde dehydrogenase